MDKVVATAADAVADVPDGASSAIAGFGLSGVPNVLIRALYERGVGGLSVVSNNCGARETGLAVLLAAGRIADLHGRLRFVKGCGVGQSVPGYAAVAGDGQARGERLQVCQPAGVLDKDIRIRAAISSTQPRCARCRRSAGIWPGFSWRPHTTTGTTVRRPRFAQG